MLFSRIERKRKTKMNTVDFINIRGQQSFLENSSNPTENDTVKNMIEKYKKNQHNLCLKVCFFQVQYETTPIKIFTTTTTTGLLDAKYSLINGKNHQAIGVINLNEIDNWEKNLKISRWVNVSFQSQLDNSQTQHFSNNFVTKNASDILDFGIKLVDDKNKEVEFADGEKKFPIVNFLIEFLA